MGVVDILSKRQRRMRDEIPTDEYQYDNLPIHFRNQVVYILQDVFLSRHWSGSDKRLWLKEQLHDVLAREFGVFKLTDGANDPWDGVKRFFLNTTNVNDALSVIETSLVSARLAQEQDRLPPFVSFKMTPSEAVEELNTRFMEHGIGYQFESPGGCETSVAAP